MEQWKAFSRNTKLAKITEIRLSRILDISFDSLVEAVLLPSEVCVHSLHLSLPLCRRFLNPSERYDVSGVRHEIGIVD